MSSQSKITTTYVEKDHLWESEEARTIGLDPAGTSDIGIQTQTKDKYYEMST